MATQQTSRNPSPDAPPDASPDNTPLPGGGSWRWDSDLAHWVEANPAPTDAPADALANAPAATPTSTLKE